MYLSSQKRKDKQLD